MMWKIIVQAVKYSTKNTSTIDPNKVSITFSRRRSKRVLIEKEFQTKWHGCGVPLLAVV
jgi:hypothetical protein